MSDDQSGNRQRRRVADQGIDALSEKIDKSISAAEQQRANIIGLIEGHGKDIKENGAQIQCLALGFKKFEPQLVEALERRNWWKKFWEERRAELITYGVKGTFITLVGLVGYALASKSEAWVRKVIVSISSP